MLAFNFFFLRAAHTLTLQDSRNWFALGVFLVTSVVVSELAARSRRRATESRCSPRSPALAARARRGGAASSSGSRPRRRGRLRGRRARDRARRGRASAREADYPLLAGGRRVGTIQLEGPARGSAAARRRLLPALASLLGVAIDRERLAREALEAEALRRSDAMKTAVLRAVSHDLRSPLMAILTSASALARDDLELDPDDERELLATILGEAAAARPPGRQPARPLAAGGRAPRSPSRRSGRWTTSSCRRSPRRARRVDGSRSSCRTSRSPSRVDARQIERVLVNLLENALKYSPEDEPVRVQVDAHAELEVLVRVVDHGPGHRAVDRERIFEPFQRGAGDGRGAGLGLAIARGFAEANGGRVWAESRPGQGATFVLALPAGPVEL